MKSIKYLTHLWILIMLFGGCREEFPVNKDLLTTVEISIEGTWTASRVWQNDVELTGYDFSEMSLTLQYSGGNPSSYSVNSNNMIPFAHSSMSGTWGVDDQVYPKYVYFISGDTVITELAKPLFSHSNTSLSIEFSLGCDENTYVFEFQKNE